MATAVCCRAAKRPLAAAASVTCMALSASGRLRAGDCGAGGRSKACECGQCAGCIERAVVKKDRAKNRQVKRRVANQEAGDKAEQGKNTGARQRKYAAN